MTDLEEYQRYITKLKILGREQPLKIDIDSSDNKITLMGVDEDFLDIDGDLEIPGFIEFITRGGLRFKNVKRVVFHNKPDRDLDLSEAFCNIGVSRIQIRFDHPERVVSLESAFQFAYKLKEVKFENLNISTVPELQNCFKSCVNLQSIIFHPLEQIEYEQENRVENMAGAFNGCKSLKDYRFLENMDLQKVKDMKSTFKDNSSLVYIDLGKLNLESVEDMTSTFEFCGKLESIGQGNNDEIISLPKLKDMTNTFLYCWSLKEFSFQNFRLPSLEIMYETFLNQGLESVNFANIKLPRLMNMRGCFSQCTQLQKARLAIVQDNSKAVRYRKAINMQLLFNADLNLKTIDIPYRLVVSDMFGAFKSTGFMDLDLQSITIKKNPFKDEKFRSYLQKSCVRVLKMPKFEERDYNGMKDFLGETLTCIKADNHWLNTVYLGRQYKKQFDLSKFKMDKIENLNNAFRYCSNLTDIKFSSGTKEQQAYPNLQSAAEMLSYTAITQIKLQKTVFNLDTSFTRMLADCMYLQDVDIDYKIKNYLDLERFDGLLVRCNNIKHVRFTQQDIKEADNISRGIQRLFFVSMDIKFQHDIAIRKLQESGFASGKSIQEIDKYSKAETYPIRGIYFKDELVDMQELLELN